MLRLEGVVKSFGGKRAVDQVSLVVPAGQLLGVIGQSGSGKSTLLRMINRPVRSASATPTSRPCAGGRSGNGGRAAP